MKHIKTYETLDGPKIGDYVICKDEQNFADLNIFLTSHIGQVVQIGNDNKRLLDYPYIVQYHENIPEVLISDYFSYFTDSINNNEISYDCRCFASDEILNYSSDIKDMEIFLVARNKYNL